MQYKNKKNLYKIVFITILLGFIISLVGCNWLSLGLLNIFDPQAQIRVNYTGMNLEEGTIALEVYSLNEAEFIGSGFKYEYYDGTTKIQQLSKTVGATFYVEPSILPGSPGPITTIDLLLYYQEVQDYIKQNPLITELTCTINLIGTDGAGHSISKSVTVDLPAIQPGIDFVAPTAVINVTPGTTGTEPFTVIFDAYGSYDNEPGDGSIRIASYAWDFGDGTTATGVMPAAHTYTNGTYFVKLTVTDYFGNVGIALETITVGEATAPIAVIIVTPSTTGEEPFTVYFDASQSSGCCSIVSYAWNFGDGETGTGITTSHEYTDAGTYIVVLTVTDSNGNTGYTSVTITVDEVSIPIAVIIVTPSTTGEEPFTVYFDASQSSSSYSIVSYDWDFGDGTTDTGITTSHEYTAVDTYVIMLAVTDSNGNTGYTSVTITVYEAGVPSTMTLQANPTTVTVGGGTSIITATVKDAGGNPVTDGTTVTFGATSPGILTDTSVTTTGGIATTTLTLTNSGTETISSTVGATSGAANANVVVYCPPVPTP